MRNKIALCIILLLNIITVSYSQQLIRSKNNATMKWGFVDTKGTIVIPYKYNNVWSFSPGGVAWVWDGEEGNASLIDKTGKVILNKKYYFVNEFKEGFSLVSTSGSTFGYINEKGIEVVQNKYNDASSFSDGLARVEQASKKGYIDKTGKIQIPLVFDNAADFDKGVAVVEKANKQMVINKTGKKAFEIVNYKIIEKFSNGVAPVYINDKGGYINFSGKAITEFKYAKWSLKHFLYDYTSVSISDGKQQGVGKAGLIDKNGKELCPFKYNNIIITYKDASIFKLGNLYGIIDNTGKEIVPAKYYDLKSTGQNLFTAKDANNLWSLIDKTGKVLTKKKYSSYIGEFQDDGYNNIWSTIYSKPSVNINNDGDEIDLSTGKIK